AEAGTETTGLEVGGVRAGGQFAVALLAGNPTLTVELAGRRVTEIAHRDVDNPVRDLECGKDLLFEGEDPLVLVGGILGLDEREHLDLFELVHPEDSPRVTSGSAGFATKTGRET